MGAQTLTWDGLADLTIGTPGAQYTITNVTTTHRIIVNANNVTITLNGVTFNAPAVAPFGPAIDIQTGDSLTLILQGANNTITSAATFAGIHVPTGAKLRILAIDESNNDSGKLTVTGGVATNSSGSGAGIGGNGSTTAGETSGTIVITSGTVIATGGASNAGGAGTGAGIGGGGGYHDPGGAGGNTGGSYTEITIDGGYVTATGGAVGNIQNSGAGAGIGGGGGGGNSGGDGGASGVINIKNGIIIAQGGNVTGVTGNGGGGGGGAGIGGGGGAGNKGAGGSAGSPTNIHITGGIIYAQGGTGGGAGVPGAAVGSGGQSYTNGNPPVITITTQPANANVLQGSITGSLSVAAKTDIAGSTLSYQWYRNTSASNSGGVMMIGETNPTLTIPTNLTAGYYYYYCVVDAYITVSSFVLNAAPLASTYAIVTVTSPNLQGTVTIDGTPVYGEELTANTNGITSSNPGAFTYTWKRTTTSGGTTTIGTSQKYTLTADDIGKNITVEVGATNFAAGTPLVSNTVVPTKKTITYTGTATATKVYDGNASYSIMSGATITIDNSSSNFTGIVGQDQITLTTPGFTDPSGKTDVKDSPITFTQTSGFSLDAASDAKYILSSQSVTVTATITKAPAPTGSFGTPAAIGGTTGILYTPTLTLASVNNQLANGYAWVTPSTPLVANMVGQTVGGVSVPQDFPATYTDPSGNYDAITSTIRVNVAKAPQLNPTFNFVDFDPPYIYPAHPVVHDVVRVVFAGGIDFSATGGQNTYKYEIESTGGGSATITEGSGVSLTITNPEITIGGGGSFNIKATKLGNDNYLDAIANVPITPGLAVPLFSDVDTTGLNLPQSTVYNGSQQGITAPKAKVINLGTGIAIGGALPVSYESGSYTRSSTPPTDAGIYTVYVDIPGTTGFYSSKSYRLGEFTIEQKVPTIGDLDITPATTAPSPSWDGSTLTYDGTSQQLVASVQASSAITGMGNVTWRYSADPKNVGTYTVYADIDGSGDNFTAGTVTLGSYTIDPLGIKITPTTTSKVYDGTTNATIAYTANPVLYSGDQFTGSLAYSGTLNPNVGTLYTIDMGTLDAGLNYTLTFDPLALLTFEIKQATTAGVPQEVLVKENYATPATTPYTFDLATLLPSLNSPLSWGTTPTYSAAITTPATDDQYGIVKTLNVSGTTLEIATNAVSGVGKTATITVTVSSQNYADFTVPVTVKTESKTPVSISATMQGGVYNGSEYKYSSLTITPAVQNYTILYESTDGNGYSSTTGPTNAGAYQLTVEVDPADPIYAGKVSFGFTIDRALITVTAESKSIMQGAPLPTTINVTYTGFVGTDTKSTAGLLTTQALAHLTVTDSNTPGQFAIDFSPQAVLSNTYGLGANYNIVHVNGTLTINKPVIILPASITGPVIVKLGKTYPATSVPYTVSGTDPVVITKISGDDKITWNSKTASLDIAPGLAVGNYKVVLRAENDGPSWSTLTVWVMVMEKYYYIDIPTPIPGGKIVSSTDNPYMAYEGQLVTFTMIPDKGYVLDQIYIYQEGNTRNIIPLGGSGLARTFTMPAYNVTVAISFRTSATNLDEATAPGLKAYAKNSVMYLSGLTPGQTWKIFNVTGQLVNQGIASDEKAEVLLPGRGIYIFTTGTKTVKVLN